jgi:hypothetical protein
MVRIYTLKELNVDVQKEREFTPQDFAKEIAKAYHEGGYANVPTTLEECNAAGIRRVWNGLCTSLYDFSPPKKGTFASVNSRIVPARYLLREAMKQYVLENSVVGKPPSKYLLAKSPNILGVGLLSFARTKKGLVVVGQIQGQETLGTGFVHGSLVGGNVDYEDLQYTSPLSHALQREADEEIGKGALDTSRLEFTHLVDERQEGNIPLCAAHIIDDVGKLLEDYAKHMAPLMKGWKEAETSGLVTIPFQPKQGLRLDNITAHISTATGIEEKVRFTPSGFRPQVQALKTFLGYPLCRKEALKRAEENSAR